MTKMDWDRVNREKRMLPRDGVPSTRNLNREEARDLASVRTEDGEALRQQIEAALEAGDLSERAAQRFSKISSTLAEHLDTGTVGAGRFLAARRGARRQLRKLRDVKPAALPRPSRTVKSPRRSEVVKSVGKHRERIELARVNGTSVDVYVNDVQGNVAVATVRGTLLQARIPLPAGSDISPNDKVKARVLSFDPDVPAIELQLAQSVV